MTTNDATLAMGRAWVETTGSLLDEQKAEAYAAEYVFRREFQNDLAQARSSLARPFESRLEDHLEQLARIRDAALSAEKFSPAVAAEIARGKAQRFYDPPPESKNPGMSDAKKMGDDELKQEAAKIIERRKLQAAKVNLKDVEADLSGRPSDFE